MSNRLKIKSNKKINIFPFVLTALVLVLAFVFFGDRLFEGKSTAESYKSFYEQVGQGKIDSVKISSGKINYTKIGSEEKFRTENPQSPTLQEYLLLNNVSVKIEQDFSQIFSNIMDIVFYLILALVVFFVFRKFISPNTFKSVRRTGVTFDDVVGMDSLKHDMKQVMDIMKHPVEYAKKGIRMPKGILLEGAPGNGKTLFAKALAGESKVNFIPAKATDFESMFMAIGPLKVKLLFKKARRKAPCIVFIDEFDGIGTRRNYSGSAIETENTRIVTALLNELDGFEPTNGVLVLAATNSISALDEALIRPGRFDSRVSVPYPDEKSRVQLVKMYSAGKNLEADSEPEILAKKFAGFSCAKIESVLNKSSLISNQKGKSSIGISEIESAMKEL